MNTSDILGFIGVFLILMAYFLNVLGKVDTTNLLFILLNLLGAGIACLASALISYYPFVILEGIWALISLLTLVNKFRTGRV